MKQFKIIIPIILSYLFSPFIHTNTMKHYTIIGNWKMTMYHKKAITFAQNHFAKLHTYCSERLTIGICPSYETISALQKLAQSTNIQIGAQNCSQHYSGAYTSQISAKSLSEIQCNLCIIGHSEVRTYLHETDEIISQKLKQLLLHNITPIICIGESLEEYKQNKIKEKIETQLKYILPIIKKHQNKTIYIAYEPIWAIGTSITPTIQELEDIFSWLRTKCSDIKLLYGGSVNDTNINELKNITNCDGFLIGGASTDFQKLQNIVLSIIEE